MNRAPSIRFRVDPGDIPAEKAARRPASLTQAVIARFIRAAKQEGLPWLEIEVGGVKVRIAISPKSVAGTVSTLIGLLSGQLA